ncbi:hypothetical protein FRC11_007962, partial [Ceratobasidium sp. 423]
GVGTSSEGGEEGLAKAMPPRRIPEDLAITLARLGRTLKIATRTNLLRDCHVLRRIQQALQGGTSMITGCRLVLRNSSVTLGLWCKSPLHPIRMITTLEQKHLTSEVRCATISTDIPGKEQPTFFRTLSSELDE